MLFGKKRIPEIAFVKERIPEADKDLFNSFDVYDYDNGEDSIFTKWYPDRNWVVDREREIYFFYVFGGHHLEQHPYQQYDLVWKGEKIVIFLDMHCGNTTNDNDPRCFNTTYDIISIRASKELKKHERELISLIKEVIKADHSTEITNSGIRKNPGTMKIEGMLIPEYFDEVR